MARARRSAQTASLVGVEYKDGRCGVSSKDACYYYYCVLCALARQGVLKSRKGDRPGVWEREE